MKQKYYLPRKDGPNIKTKWVYHWREQVEIHEGQLCLCVGGGQKTWEREGKSIDYYVRNEVLKIKKKKKSGLRFSSRIYEYLKND